MIQRQNTTRFTQGSAAGGVAAADSGPNGRVGLENEFAPDEAGLGYVWEQVLGQLRASTPTKSFETWIANLEMVAEVGEEVLIAAASELDCTMVENRYGREIREAWARFDPLNRNLRLKARDLISEDILALSRPAPTGKAGQPGGQPRTADDVRDVLKTLDSYLVGDSNKAAFNLVKQIVDCGDAPAPFVTIVGPHGVGKSHLLYALNRGLDSRRPMGETVFFSAEDFTSTFVDGIKRNDTSELRATMRKAKVLILDDLQLLMAKPKTLIEFFAHARAIAANGGLVVMSCDKSPALLEIDHRMRDELLGGIVTMIDLPDENLRREIVRAKAAVIAERDPEFVFPEDWVEMVAERLPTSGRALYGVVRNVYVSSRLGGRSLSKELVEEAVQGQLGGVPQRAPKIDTVKDVTSRHYGITKADLESPCRKRAYAQPRQYAMYLCRKLTRNSYPMIGREFGGRDHTTVLFAFRKISKLVKTDPALAEELRQLEGRVRSDPRNFR